MSNPFGEPDDSDADGEILEGFICPICRDDLKSLEFLTEHFDKSHAEDDDLKTLFKEIFSKAKKKINFDLSRSLEKKVTISTSRNGEPQPVRDNSNAHTRMNIFNFMDHQEVGVERSLMEYFQSVRNPRLERYANETNKLIIRLHKLLKDMPSDTVLRKQHEQNIVPWLDGSSVKLCPNCAKSFHIARRQHHCRLCGSIMCHDCSKFLSLETALQLASLTMAHSSEPLKQTTDTTNTSSSSNPSQNGIRSCDHCLWLLETRQEMHESRTCRPPITQIYADIQKLSENVMPDIETYLKIINSLCEGESIFTLNDASALRGKIGQVAEAIDILSKRIIAIVCEPGTREESLKKAIRLSCIQLIKEKMLSLPPLPKEAEIRKIQERKRMETELRIQTERRQAMEAYERYGLSASSNTEHSLRSGDYAQGSDLRSLDNWTAHQISTAGLVHSDDPLVEQINIIKGYIKQARQDMNFDVVETLEINLRDLQKEFYERQKSISAIQQVDKEKHTSNEQTE